MPPIKRNYHGKSQPWLLKYLQSPYGIVSTIVIFAIIVALMRQQIFIMLGTILGHAITRPISSFCLDESNTLRLQDPSSTFRISIFEDLHFGEDEDTFGPPQDQASLQVMSTILGSESPHLVVLNGDMITGENTFAHNSTLYLDVLLAPIVASNTPFATVYGNHDSEKNISTIALYEHEKENYSRLSLTGRAVNGTQQEVGVSNYFLAVFFSGNSSTKPDLLLWFFDSRGGKEHMTRKQLPSQVSPIVAQWFSTTSSSIKKFYGTDIPGLAFVHIPVSKVWDFQEENGREDFGPPKFSPYNGEHKHIDPKLFPGIDEDVPISPQGNDDAFLNALVNDSSIKAVFSGHDHGNDWCMPHPREEGESVFFCFSSHTGYGGYSNWIRGSRTVEIDVDCPKDNQIKTWIRFEDGTAGQTVVLNSTYGQDQYDPVPWRCTHVDHKSESCP